MSRARVVRLVIYTQAHNKPKIMQDRCRRQKEKSGILQNAQAFQKSLGNSGIYQLPRLFRKSRHFMKSLGRKEKWYILIVHHMMSFMVWQFRMILAACILNSNKVIILAYLKPPWTPRVRVGPGGFRVGSYLQNKAAGGSGFSKSGRVW